MQRLLLILSLISTIALMGCSSTESTTSTALPEVTPPNPDQVATDSSSADAIGVALLSIKCDTSLQEEQSLHLQLSKKEENEVSLFHSSKSLAISCQQKPLLTAVQLPIGTYRVNNWTLSQLKPQPLLKPFYFSIKAHQVTYLGQITLTQDKQDYMFAVMQNVAKKDIDAMQKYYPDYKAFPVRRVV